MTSLAVTTQASTQVVDEQVCFAICSAMLGVQRTYRRVLKRLVLPIPGTWSCSFFGSVTG